MRLLLISNSTNPGEEFLGYSKAEIAQFLQGVKQVAFVPYAAVTFSYDTYLERVQARFNDFNIRVDSLHQSDNPAELLAHSEAIVVGGGNTFHLLRELQRAELLPIIRRRVVEGTPYVGWSAGSNLACPTICTTNDMPIVEPLSFRALGLVPFQINPHYLDAHPDGHAGETREQRIQEYITANADRFVVGLREGCMLRLEGEQLTLLGPRPIRLFKQGEPTLELDNSDDLSFLLSPTQSPSRGSEEAKERGVQGENLASQYLSEQGYQILERNWRSGKDELDIIARRADTLHIVEVKSRASHALSTPEQGITEQKFRVMSRATRAYLATQNRSFEVSFDLIGVEFDPSGSHTLRHEIGIKTPTW